MKAADRTIARGRLQTAPAIDALMAGPTAPRADARPRQLPLPFDHRPRFAAAGFIAAPSNEEALAWLARTPDWPQGRLALWGESGCGKTHLLHRWAARHQAPVLPGAGLRLEPPTGPIAIDDAETAPEPALLHWLNGAAEAGHPVLLAALLPPARWTIRLPDLASRLRAMLAVPIGPPDDELLRALLASLVVERQMKVPEAMQLYLLQRLPRTAWAMREAARQLDRLTMAAGGALTRAVANAVIEAVCAQEQNDAPPPPNDEDCVAIAASPSSGAPRFL